MSSLNCLQSRTITSHVNIKTFVVTLYYSELWKNYKSISWNVSKVHSSIKLIFLRTTESQYIHSFPRIFAHPWSDMERRGKIAVHYKKWTQSLIFMLLQHTVFENCKIIFEIKAFLRKHLSPEGGGGFITDRICPTWVNNLCQSDLK